MTLLAIILRPIGQGAYIVQLINEAKGGEQVILAEEIHGTYTEAAEAGQGLIQGYQGS